MSYFFYKLIPPRPTFAGDMTAAERALMGEHGAYWRDLARQGVAVIFGPVADPKGGWGMAVVEADTEATARALGVGDPTIKAAAGFHFEMYPMPQGILRGSAPP